MHTICIQRQVTLKAFVQNILIYSFLWQFNLNTDIKSHDDNINFWGVWFLTGISSGSTGNLKGLESSHWNIVSRRVRHSDFQESGFLLLTGAAAGFFLELVPGWSSSDCSVNEIWLNTYTLKNTENSRSIKQGKISPLKWDSVYQEE